MQARRRDRGGGAGCEENLSDPQLLPHPLPVVMAAYKLVLIRHGESAWNLENRFSGWYDADLSPAGHEEAKRGGQALRGTSELDERGVAYRARTGLGAA